MPQKDSLGRPATFLLPSLKLKRRADDGRTLEDHLEAFLLEEFGGYTASGGNIWGKWRDPEGHEHYGEHRAFTVAFAGRERIPGLEQFLAQLAAQMDEQTVYLEIGEDAWLLHATPPA